MESSPITIPIKPDNYRSIARIGAFQPGNILRIKVLELTGNRALIDYGAGRTTADIKIPVAVGEELLVKVHESTSQPKLELLSADAKSISGNGIMVLRTPTLGLDIRSVIQSDLNQLLAQLLGPDGGRGVAGHLRQGLVMLNAYFESVDPEKQTSEIPPRLMAYTNNSGVFFEKMLQTAIQNIRYDQNSVTPGQLSRHPEVQTILNRDLKSILFMLQNVADDDPSLQRPLDSGPGGRLRKSIEFLLGDITRQQSRAVKLSESPDPFQSFSFSLPLAHDRQTARLKVYYPKKQRTGSRPGFQISLLLSMDHLGDIRTDLYLLDRDLSETFFVRSKTAHTKIKQYQIFLQELLNPCFNQTVLRVVISEKKVDDFEHEDVEVATDRRVDLRI